MLDTCLAKKKIKENISRFIKWRRAFHEIPELGMEEHKTTDMICGLLKEMDICPRRLEPTGVTAYIGPEQSDTIALRADIDGLKVLEETGLPFCSKHPGLMHACGHDGHIAGLLGAAYILKEMEDLLTVRVKLIFQPSEENTLGAKKMIAQGVLDDVDAIFGLHLFSDMDTGLISLEAGPRMAQTDRFFLTFHGKGGHAGKPHQCVDATVMAADFVMSLQTIVAREIDPLEGAVVTVGSFHSGSQYNIISGEARIEGTCRSFSAETAKKLKEAVEKRAEAVAGYYGGSVTVSYDFGSHPPVWNEPELTGQIVRGMEQWFAAAGRSCGPETKTCRETESEESMFDSFYLAHIPPLMLGEDFSWYQTRVPGAFAFVGCGGPKQEVCYPNHHPRFDVDENALFAAAALHVAAVQAAMERKESAREVLQKSQKAKPSGREKI